MPWRNGRRKPNIKIKLNKNEEVYFLENNEYIDNDPWLYYFLLIEINFTSSIYNIFWIHNFSGEKKIILYSSTSMSCINSILSFDFFSQGKCFEKVNYTKTS